MRYRLSVGSNVWWPAQFCCLRAPVIVLIIFEVKLIKHTCHFYSYLVDLIETTHWERSVCIKAIIVAQCLPTVKYGFNQCIGRFYCAYIHLIYNRTLTDS